MVAHLVLGFQEYIPPGHLPCLWQPLPFFDGVSSSYSDFTRSLASVPPLY